MNNTKFLLVDINKIIPYKLNNKNHGANIDEICKSIEKVGMRDPLEVDENFVLLSGHGRLLALQKMGVKEVNVIQYLDMTQDQKDAYRLLANRIADFSSYNIENIKLELERLNDLDLFRAFDSFDIKFFEDKVDEDNEDVVPIPKDNDPLVQQGDIFQLGNHILMCGDSTKKEDRDKVYGKVKMDMLFTDPPYNINYKGSGKKTKQGIKNDNMDDDMFIHFLDDVFSCISLFSKKDIPMYIFHSHKTQKIFEDAMNKSGIGVLYQLIRNKPSVNHVGGDYKQKHEPFFYASNGDPKFYGDIYDTTVRNNRKDLSDKELLSEIKKLQEAEKQGKTTIRSMRRHNTQDYVHPTQKPVGIITTAIKNSSCSGNVIGDPFAGSGSTLIACEKNQRICLTMELDPKFVEVIISRYFQYTKGNKEIKCLNREIAISDILSNT